MAVRKKGKILKIKKGYNPNCSSGMWMLMYVFYGILAFGATAVLSIISESIISRRHITNAIKKNEIVEISEKYESEI